MAGPAGRGGLVVSLITEALQLRKNQPRSRARPGESFPPMRRTSPVAKLFLVLVVLLVLVVVTFWKGLWLLEKVENLAGIQTTPPVVRATENMAAEETPPKVTFGPVAEASVPGDVPAASAPVAQAVPARTEPATAKPISPPTIVAEPQAKGPGSAAPSPEKTAILPAELQPMDVNLSLALIEDEKARQQLDEENQRKIETFLRRMDVQGVCHQGSDSTALLDTMLVRPGDPVGDLGLTLRTIEARRLVFADRSGREYTKNY